MSPPQQWGGGGGFGQPPGGGGGGGFGQPPGGGGFGQPPGGGGFGQPPGGGGGGGFGAPPPQQPPPGGGGGGGGGYGEAPLGRIPFTPDDEKNISQTALFMRAAGGLSVLNALYGLVGSIGVGLFRGTEGSEIAGNVCGGGFMLLVWSGLAVLLFMAANAFSKIVSSDGNDQVHLAEGLKQLRIYFLVKAIGWVLVFLLCCACIGLGLIFGAALMSALGGAMSH